MSLKAIGQLRTIEPSELEIMLSWRNSPSVRANMYTCHEISLTEHLAWWERIQEDNNQLYFMYEFQGVPLGVVAFTEVNIASHNSSWAFYASPEAPKGTGSKMEFLALEHAFNDMKLNKLCCEVLAFNTPVIKLHQKFGFKVEGILREQHYIERSPIDVYCLGILSSEWHEKKDAMREKILKLSKV